MEPTLGPSSTERGLPRRAAHVKRPAADEALACLAALCSEHTLAMNFGIWFEVVT
jgi:hypothetical protein